MELTTGIPTLDNYKKLLTSDVFAEMEAFSNNFLAKNHAHLVKYGNKWLLDSFHQWSRQWEYPFVYQMITRYLATTSSTTYQILDAGCGATFFPHYIATRFPQIKLTGCDYDQSLSEIIGNINSTNEQPIDFVATPMQKMPFNSHSFDIIYCISVLEHTKNYEEILQEFSRILKPSGMLILTFDLALDGISDIPPILAEKLLQTIARYFTSIDDNSLIVKTLSNSSEKSDIVTTQYMKEFNPQLLPWKYPFLSLLKSCLKNRRFPTRRMKNLTVYCYAGTK